MTPAPRINTRKTKETKMNTVEEIQKTCDEIAAKMLAKGLIEPRCQCAIESDCLLPRVYMRWKPVASDRCVSDEYHWAKGNALGELLENARRWADALPTREEQSRQQFAKLISAALEFGRERGFDDVLVNPLAEAMKKLSENALEDLRA